MDTLLYKKNMIPFYTKKIWKYDFPHHFLKKNILLIDLSARRVYPDLCQCPIYAVILQTATLANLNVNQNYFSELTWVVSFKQVTFLGYYGFPE